MTNRAMLRLVILSYYAVLAVPDVLLGVYFVVLAMRHGKAGHSADHQSAMAMTRTASGRHSSR